ncbi:MAG: HAD-IA family hydrolase [Bacteroidetes bacterium]|nr:HAD-IA family hydrolase [Bacteroidota bacterium]
MQKTFFNIRNIIFDLDGTIVDSKKDIATAQLLVLQDYGINNISENELYPHIGKSLHETFSSLLPLELHSKLDEASEKYTEYYVPNSLKTTTLFPSVFDLLNILSQNNFKMAIATTKRGSGALRATNHFGITNYFSQIQGSDNIPFKPNPTIINLILEKQNWKNEETIIVGDTDKDILVGKNSEISTCGVTWGAMNFEELQKFNPDIIINNPLELITYLIK